MEKRFISFLIIFELLILSIFFIYPIPILANGDIYEHGITVGSPGGNTDIWFRGSGYTDYYKLLLLYNSNDVQIDYAIASYISNYPLPATQSNPWDIDMTNVLAAGDYYYKLIIAGDYDIINSEAVYFDSIIIESYNFTVSAGAVPQVLSTWVRSKPVMCWNVWINEEGDFQFVFLYPFKDNNWVRIYDLDGNMVYETDLPYNNPNLIVDLPDGIYTVKTYHCSDDPIQEFIIGKP